MHLGATGEVQTTGVSTKVEGLRMGMSDQSQVGTVGHDNGTEGEIVHPDGGDDEAAAIGREDRTATTEGIGSRAGWGCHYETVAAIGGNKVVVDKEVSTQQRGIVEAMQADLVEGDERILGRVGDYLKEGAWLKGIASAHDVGHQRINVIVTGSGEKTEMTEVDAENRHIPASNEMNGTEQCTVATNRKEEIVVDADGQGFGNLVGFDTAGMQTINEGQQLLAQGGFEVTDVEGNFHLKLKTKR